MVDDEAFNIFAIKGLLKILNMDDSLVDTCYDGKQAVDLVKAACDNNEPLRYGLILTDCSMPVMDGYLASRAIRALVNDRAEDPKKLKIVAITGHVEDAYIKKAIDHGIDEVFPKPIPVRDLGQLLVDLQFIKAIPKAVLEDD